MPKVEQTKTPNFIDFKDLTINAIGLDSTEENVVKTLGKPRSIKKQFNGCLDDQMKTFFYKGLELSLSENLETKKWEVFEIELTSSKWQLDSGIKIGDSIESVKQKIGKDFSESEEKGVVCLSYGNTNGGATFYFRNNKLEKISWDYTIC